MGTETFRLSRETKEVVRENIGFFDTVKELGQETKLGLKGNDLETRTEVQTRADGSVEVTFVYPIDDNDKPQDGRLYLKDQFVFDSKERKLTDFKRRFELAPGAPADPKWAEWAKKYQQAADAKPLALDDPKLQNFAMLVGRSYSRPLNSELKKAFRDQIGYLTKAGQAAQTLLPDWMLKLGDVQAHFSVVRREKELHVTVTIPIDDDADPANGRIFFHDRFTLDSGDLKLKKMERTWSVAPEVAGAPLARLEAVIKRLNAMADPAQEEAEKYIAGLGKALPLKEEPAGETHLPETWKSGFPPGYQAPLAKRAEKRKAQLAAQNQGREFGLNIAYAYASDALAKRHDDSKGWLSFGPTVRLEAEKQLIDSIFQKAAKQLEASPSGSVSQLLRGLALNPEESRVLEGILGDSTFQKIDSASAEPDSALRSHGLLVIAREDLLKKGYGNAAVATAEGVKSLAGGAWKTSENALQWILPEADRDLDFAGGKGSIGTKLEYLAPMFIEQTTKPSMLFAMLGSGLLGPVSELGALKFLSRFGAVGKVGRFGSHLAGIGGEAAAFTTLHKFGDSFYNNPDKVWTHWGSETVSAMLLFGGMRLAHGAAGWTSVKMSEGRLGTVFGGKVPSGTPGLPAPAFASSPTGRIYMSQLPPSELAASVPMLTRWGNRATATLNHGGAIFTMYGAGGMSRVLGLQPANDQGLGGHFFDATVMYTQALVGFRLADGLVSGRFQPQVAEMKLRLKQQAEGSENVSVPIPAWERFFDKQTGRVRHRALDLWDSGKEKSKQLENQGQRLSRLFGERDLPETRIEKLRAQLAAQAAREAVPETSPLSKLWGRMRQLLPSAERSQKWKESFADFVSYLSFLKPSKQRATAAAIENLSSRIETVEAERNAASADAQSKGEEITRLETELDDLLQGHVLGRDQVGEDAPTDVRDPSSPPQAAKVIELASHRALRERIAELSAEKQGVEADRQTALETIQQKELEIQSLRREQEEAMARLEQEREAERLQTQSKAEQDWRQIDALKTEKSALEKFGEEKAQRIGELETNLSHSEMERGNIQIEAESRQKRIETLEGEKAAVERNAADLGQQILGLQARIGELVQGHQELGRKFAAQGEELGSAQQEVGQKTQRITELDTHRSQALAEVKAKDAELAALKEELEQLRRDFEATEDSIEIRDEEPPIRLGWASKPLEVTSETAKKHLGSVDAYLAQLRGKLKPLLEGCDKFEAEMGVESAKAEPNAVRLKELRKGYRDSRIQSNELISKLEKAKAMATAIRVIYFEALLREEQGQRIQVQRGADEQLGLLAQQLENARTEAESLRPEVGKRVEAEAEAARNRSDLEALRTQTEEMENRAQVAEDQASQLRVDNENNSLAARQAEARAGEAEGRESRIRTELELARAELDRLREIENEREQLSQDLEVAQNNLSSERERADTAELALGVERENLIEADRKLVAARRNALELSEQLTAKEKELHEATAGAEALNQWITRLDGEKNQIEAQLRTKDAEIQQLKNDLEKAIEEAADITEEALLQTQIEELSEQITTGNSTRLELQGRLQARETELAGLRTQLAAEQEGARVLTEELGAERVKAQRAIDGLARLSLEYESYVQTHEENLDVHLKENAEYGERVLAAEARTEAAERMLIVRAEEARLATLEAEAQAGENQLLSARLGSAEEEILAKGSRIEEMQAPLRNLEGIRRERDGFEQQVTALRESVAENEKWAREAEARATEHERRANDFENNEIPALKENVEILERRLEEERQGRAEALRQSQANYDAAGRNYETAMGFKAQVEALERQLLEAGNELALMQTRLAEKVAELGSRDESHQQVIRDFQTDVQDLTAEHTRLRDQIQSRLDEASIEIASLRDDVESHQAVIQTWQERLENFAGYLRYRKHVQAFIQPHFAKVDPRSERVETSINARSFFRDANDRVIGEAQIIAGGQEGAIREPFLDGSQVSARTSRGGRKSQQDGIYSAWFVLPDGTEVKVFAGADGAGGMGGGEIVSSAFLQGIHAGVLDALAEGKIPTAGELHLQGAKTGEFQKLQPDRAATASRATGAGAVVVVVGDQASIATVGDATVIHQRLDAEGQYETLGYTNVDVIQNKSTISKGIHEYVPRLYHITGMKKGDRFIFGSDGFWENILGEVYKDQGSMEMRQVMGRRLPTQAPFRPINLLADATQGREDAAQYLHDLAYLNINQSGQIIPIGNRQVLLPKPGSNDNIFVFSYEHGTASRFGQLHLPDHKPLEAVPNEARTRAMEEAADRSTDKGKKIRSVQEILPDSEPIPVVDESEAPTPTSPLLNKEGAGGGVTAEPWPPKTPPAPPPEQLELENLGMPVPILRFPAGYQTLHLGREKSSTEPSISLPNETISRSHARIYRTPQGYILEHLGTNPTIVAFEGQIKVVLKNKGERVELSDGSQLQMGDAAIQFKTAESKDEPAAKGTAAPVYQGHNDFELLEIYKRYHQHFSELYGPKADEVGPALTRLYQNFPGLEAIFNPELMNRAPDGNAQGELLKALTAAILPQGKDPAGDPFYLAANRDVQLIANAKKPVPDPAPEALGHFSQVYRQALWNLFGMNADQAVPEFVQLYALQPSLETALNPNILLGVERSQASRFFRQFLPLYHPDGKRLTDYDLYDRGFKSLGAVKILFEGGPVTVSPAAANLRLKIERGGQIQSFGSLQTNDSLVSARHLNFQFSEKDKEWQVRDAGSEHGTWLNGKEISQPPDSAQRRPFGHWQSIESGDSLHIGNSQLKVALDADGGLLLEAISAAPQAGTAAAFRPPHLDTSNNSLFLGVGAQIFIESTGGKELGLFRKPEARSFVLYTHKAGFFGGKQEFGFIAKRGDQFELNVLVDKKIKVQSTSGVTVAQARDQIVLKNGDRIYVDKMVYTVVF